MIYLKEALSVIASDFKKGESIIFKILKWSQGKNMKRKNNTSIRSVSGNDGVGRDTSLLPLMPLFF